MRLGTPLWIPIKNVLDGRLKICIVLRLDYSLIFQMKIIENDASPVVSSFSATLKVQQVTTNSSHSGAQHHAEVTLHAS
jgi:hypothetical protein